MACFRIYKEKENNKENSTVNIPVKAKNTKQPLGLHNTNQINQKKNANPLDEAKIHKTVKNVDYKAKKSSDQAISLPEEKMHYSPKSVERLVLKICSFDTEQNNKQVIQTKDTTKLCAYEEVHYQKDILTNCREGELKHRPKPYYMLSQKDISHRMRSVLIDWLVEVALDYDMNTETLYLTVSYIDRFLSLVAVQRNVLQLVGTTALFIACKFEEITPPQVDELIYATDDTYTKDELLRMEKVILKRLSFNLVTPTAYAFVRMYAVMCDDMCDVLKSLAMYISELSLLNGDVFLLYLPSLISSAALALARHILGMEMWSPQLEEITTYKLKDLKSVLLVLSKNHIAAKGHKLQAIQNKYKKKQYGNVAEIEDIELTYDQFDQLCLAYEAQHGTKI